MRSRMIGAMSVVVSLGLCACGGMEIEEEGQLQFAPNQQLADEATPVASPAPAHLPPTISDEQLEQVEADNRPSADLETDRLPSKQPTMGPVCQTYYKGGRFCIKCCSRICTERCTRPQVE